MFYSLQPHGLQYARLPCPSLSPGVGSNSFPLSWWCYPTISSSVTPFSSCLQSFPASKSLTIRWPKYWHLSFSINPSSEYSELISFRIDRSDLLVVEGTQDSSPVPQFKSINSLALTLHYGPTLMAIQDFCLFAFLLLNFNFPPILLRSNWWIKLQDT